MGQRDFVRSADSADSGHSGHSGEQSFTGESKPVREFIFDDRQKNVLSLAPHLKDDKSIPSFN